MLAALEGVCRHEAEQATRCRLRLFAHPDASVRATLANCFAHYFHEEEAVVHRNYLALPYLVEALSDGDDRVQIAAARALGNESAFAGRNPCWNSPSAHQLLVSEQKPSAPSDSSATSRRWPAS